MDGCNGLKAEVCAVGGKHLIQRQQVEILQVWVMGCDMSCCQRPLGLSNNAVEYNAYSSATGTTSINSAAEQECMQEK
jgi:hypothetical protein